MSERRKGAIAVLVLLAAVIPVSGQDTPGARSFVGDDVSIITAEPGGIQILGGSLEIEADVGGDVVAILSDVTLAPGATIEGDLYVIGGSLSNEGEVAGSLYAPRSIETALSEGTRGVAGATTSPFSLATLTLKLGSSLGWLILTVLLTLIVSRNVRAASVETGAAPFYSFFLGLVALSSFAVTALAASYLVGYGVGEVLLVLLAVFAIATKIFGMVAVFLAVGRMLFAPRSRGETKRGRIRGDLAWAVVGLLLLTALRMIPVVGNVVWAALSLVGTGAALSTFFGSREPAFLSYQPVGSSS